MKIIIIYFLFLFLPIISIGQAIPIEIKKTIAFIYVKNNNGKIVPNGTGFFVGIRDTSQENRYGVSLVTAKHVIQKEDKKTLVND